MDALHVPVCGLAGLIRSRESLIRLNRESPGGSAARGEGCDSNPGVGAG